MTAFKALCRREWRAGKWMFVVAAGLIAAWAVGWAWFAAFKSEVPGEAVGFAVMPLLGSFVWAIVAGLWTVDEEWKRGTVNQVLMWPVRGTTVLAAKLAVYVLVTALQIIAVLAGAYAVWLAGGRPFLEVNRLAPSVGSIWLLVIVTVIYLLTVMAATAARCVRQTWGRVVGVAAFVGGVLAVRPFAVLISRAIDVLWPHVQPIDLCLGLQRDGGHVVWSVCPVPSPVLSPHILVNILWAVGLFVLAAYLLERRAEV